MTLRMSVAAAVLAAGVHAAPAAAQERPAAAPPACQISSDPDFALTPQKAMRVGGGAMYVAARERRYLEGLRGPAGQPLTFRRLGSTRVPPNVAPIDHWQVSYDGLAEPIGIYLDAYHYEEPKAPVGFTCVPFALGPPPVDGFLASQLLARLAIDEAAGGADAAPIPLAPDGSTTFGVAFDQFRMMVRKAKVSAASGQKIDLESPPRDFMYPGMVLVAYPLTCGERRVAPANIEIVPRQGPVIRSEKPPVSGADIRTLLPGEFTAPEGSVAVMTQLGMLRPGDAVRITYASETCGGPAKDTLLRAVHTSAKPAQMPQPAAPAGVNGPIEPVWLQVVIDHAGAFRAPSHIGGPEALLTAATAAIKEWRAEPARINGAPVTFDTLLFVRFK